MLITPILESGLSATTPRHGDPHEHPVATGFAKNVTSPIDFCQYKLYYKNITFIAPDGLLWTRVASEGPDPGRPAGNRQGGALVFKCSYVLIPYVWNLRPGGAWPQRGRQGIGIEELLFLSVHAY